MREREKYCFLLRWTESVSSLLFTTSELTSNELLSNEMNQIPFTRFNIGDPSSLLYENTHIDYPQVHLISQSNIETRRKSVIVVKVKRENEASGDEYRSSGSLWLRRYIYSYDTIELLVKYLPWVTLAPGKWYISWSSFTGIVALMRKIFSTGGFNCRYTYAYAQSL